MVCWNQPRVPRQGLGLCSHLDKVLLINHKIHSTLSCFLLVPLAMSWSYFGIWIFPFSQEQLALVDCAVT